ncbi:MAG: glycosyltransferase family 9 protein [Bacteroidota bacterium]|nr:glycosyltransferase family 9 protein [Bacteroidota bacterium]MDP4234345.1 glycosyltransferase family 9 protein [Bacteroidota bacterium]MDP4243279.1 glycosyltransferase family 9 protein [Bacteroidota bacterium]MDP4289104.1 glycosyltransferase family 9 protein [Bacteroidota bacterium]
MLKRTLSILYLLSRLAISWVRHILGLSKAKHIRLGEEIEPQIGELRSILLFGYMGMGDAVMFEPALRAFLHRFPKAQFDLVVGRGSQSLAILKHIMWEHGREFRSIIMADFKAMSRRELKSLNSTLADNSYEACIAVYTTPIQYYVSAIESIPIRIGHAIRAQAWYKPRPNYLFNIARTVDQNIDEREPYRHYRLAQAVGIQSQGELPVPRITISDQNQAWARDFLQREGLHNKELIAVHLGVSKAMNWKKWSDERYAAVFERLRKPNRHFLFFGGVDEREEIEIARAHIIEVSSVFAGSLDVIQVGALLTQCKMTIGNDSGIGHLSIAIGTPTFRIFGPSDHYGCEPYSEEHVTLYKDLSCSPCMNLGLIKAGYNVLNCGHRNCLGYISVDEVTDSISNLLTRK